MDWYYCTKCGEKHYIEDAEYPIHKTHRRKHTYRQKWKPVGKAWTSKSGKSLNLKFKNSSNTYIIILNLLNDVLSGKIKDAKILSNS